MAKLTEWIEQFADGESVEAVVIGEMGWGDYGTERVPGYVDQPRNKVLSWDQAKAFLSYDFDDGFGAPACNAVTVWTKSWVIGVSQYDGSTAPFRMPRHPVEHEPQMPGG